MKGAELLIAVTAMEKNLDSPVSDRFGRTAFVFVADTQTRVVRIIDNHAHASMGLGAGARTAEMLARLGVEWVATGEIGRESFSILQASGIRVVTRASGTCREALDRLSAGNLTPALCPTDPTARRVDSAD